MHGSSLKDVVLDDSVEDDDVEESLEVDVLYLFTNILRMKRNPEMTLTMLLMVILMVKMSHQIKGYYLGGLSHHGISIPLSALLSHPTRAQSSCSSTGFCWT